MLTPSQFRLDFPEFGNATRYPDSQVTFWQTFAGNLLNSRAWGNLLTQGTELFIAHQLTLSARRQAQAAVSSSGGASPVPGLSAGMVAAKSVDKVSISYDTASVSIKDAGQWNATEYGVQFYQLVRMVGVVGISQHNGPQLGGGGLAAPFGII